MTWAKTSVRHSIQSTRLFLKKNLWAWPIVAVLVLSVVGFSIRSAIESTMRSSVQSQLQTLLDVEVAMLQSWLKVQQSNAEAVANSNETQNFVKQLLEAVDPTNPMPQQLSTLMVHRELEKYLGPTMSTHRYVGFLVADKSRTILSASNASMIGQRDIPSYEKMLDAALEGRSTVSSPFPSASSLKSSNGQYRTNMPTMYVVAPVRDDNFQIIAVLGLQMRPEEEFTKILQLGRLGESGETYAIDRDAKMVSNSRFDTELMLLGLIPQENDTKSLLTIQVRDPGGNMLEGFRPGILRSEMPPTRMASSVIAGNDGFDIDGYHDYRGVPVVGAWKWLDDYALGIATEIDHAEAFKPLTILKWAFWGLFALLVASSVAIFVFTLVVARLQRDAQKAAIEAKEIGQYQLLEKLGQGAMGVVYKGQHAMLRRQTAIKMLDVERINDASIARFEREVQITCQLNNPNTIAIYDYGRTPEGVFYYAMEYLDGINLEALVEKAGPQPESRVIHLLLQICGSLFEAHSLGLVHRDIKPANIMLNRRGGLSDVIKVLDFGLVKALDEKKQAGMTAANSLTGTPLYISPEAINSPGLVDARSDLYAVGATGYFLLTGRPPFVSDNLVDLLRMHSMDSPLPPSERLRTPVSEPLEAAIMACLEKNPANRPQTARDLSKLLTQSAAYGKWRVEDGDAWWGRYDRGQLKSSESNGSPAPRGAETRKAAPEQTMISNYDDDTE